MKIRIEVDERKLVELVEAYIEHETGREVDKSKLSIETKSQQNYKSQWEKGAGFRAVYEVER